MTDITLTRLEVRTGSTPDWLYLRAAIGTPWGQGRLYTLLPLVPDLNFGHLQTHFDPDSLGADAIGGAAAMGTVLISCGCTRSVDAIGTEEASGNALLSFHTKAPEFVDRRVVGCTQHGNDFDEWRGRPDPLRDLSTTISREELTAIRNSVTARREGVEPMWLAGLYGAAGVGAAETHSLSEPRLQQSLAASAAPRGGFQTQAHPEWFRVR